jgi:hypothetical protein
MAWRLRQATTMTLKWIAKRLRMSPWTCVSNCPAKGEKQRKIWKSVDSCDRPLYAMQIEKALAILVARIYEWSSADFIRELENNCPLLTLIATHNRHVGAFISWAKTLSLEDRRRMAKAMITLYHENARVIKGESITEEVAEWGEKFYDETTARFVDQPPLPTADSTSPSFVPATVDAVIGCLRNKVSQKFGLAQVWKSRLRCSIFVNDWNILTEFGYAEEEHNLAFEYQFVRKDWTPIFQDERGPFPRNLLSMYGLYPHCVVAVPSIDDIEPMTTAMVRLAEQFVSQSSHIFIGIGMKD